MQKKKKASKAKAAAKKTVSKVAQAKPAAKKVAKKPHAKAEKAVMNKSEPVAAAKRAVPKAEKLKAKPVQTEAPAPVSMLSKEEFKNMTPEAQEHYKKWLKLHKQLSVEKPLEYKMTSDFEIKAPISHRVHGWGVVIQKRDNYIDVLFEGGLKTLIVNYKP